jgi:hypothetical protein
MSDDPSDRPTVDLHFPTPNSIAAAVVSLTGALQIAVEMAVFPERLTIEDKSARLSAVTEKLLRAAKSKPTERISDTDELAGMDAALSLIRNVDETLRRKI